LKISKEKRLEVVDAIAKGQPLTKALASTGRYSPSSVSHASVAIISTKPYRDTMRQYAETLAQTVGEQSIAAELELIRVGKAPFREARAALQAIWQAYSAKVDGASVKEFKAQNGDQFAVIKKQVNDAFWSAEAQAKIQHVREKAKAIQPGDLSSMAKVGLAEDLLDQPKDPRARNANRRLAGELDGLIGTNSNNLHLHQHNHNTSSPSTRQMIAETLIRVALETEPGRNLGEIAAEVEAVLSLSDADKVRLGREQREREEAMQEEYRRKHAIDVILQRPDPIKGQIQ
jgi:hypothetical protein